MPCNFFVLNHGIKTKRSRTPQFGKEASIFFNINTLVHSKKIFIAYVAVLSNLYCKGFPSGTSNPPSQYIYIIDKANQSHTNSNLDFFPRHTNSGWRKRNFISSLRCTSLQFFDQCLGCWGRDANDICSWNHFPIRSFFILLHCGPLRKNKGCLL